MILYALRSLDTAFSLAKFDDDFNVASTYTLVNGSCDCPSHKPRCKHFAILDAFTKTDRANTDWFYCYERQSWHQPLGQIDAAVSEAIATGPAQIDLPFSPPLPDLVTTAGTVRPEADAGSQAPQGFRRRV